MIIRYDDYSREQHEERTENNEKQTKTLVHNTEYRKIINHGFDKEIREGS